MKKVVLLSIISFFIGSSSVALAANEPLKPCQHIRQACLAAGFVKGDKSGRAIWKDCIKLILMGQTVAGVMTNPSDVQACQAKKAKRDASTIPKQ